MANPVNPVAGPSNERAVSPVEAALDARERRMERARIEERVAEKQRAQPVQSGTAVDAAARTEAAEPIRPYRVTLDPRTSQLYTEVLNTDTGEVVLRIPPTYVEPDNPVDTTARGEDEGENASGEEGLEA